MPLPPQMAPSMAIPQQPPGPIPGTPPAGAPQVQMPPAPRMPPGAPGMDNPATPAISPEQMQIAQIALSDPAILSLIAEALTQDPNKTMFGG